MDKLNLKGILSLKFYEKEVLFKEETQANLIVAVGYNAMLRMLSGDDIYIEKIQVGTESEFADDSNTAITTPLDLTITNRTITNRKITFNFIFGADQGNGSSWCEFGLICSDGTLFSRRVWVQINKIADLTINGTWEINL